MAGRLMDQRGTISTTDSKDMKNRKNNELTESFPEVPKDLSIDELLKLSMLTYDQAAVLYEQRWFDFWKTTHGFKVLSELLSQLPTEASVLDIGSGVGDIAKFFTDAGKAVVCVDLSQGMLDVVARRAPVAKRLLMDARNLDLDDDTFDLVIVSHMLPFLDKEGIRKVLTECTRVLKQKGSLYISACGKDSGVREWLTDEKNKVGEVYLHGINADVCTEVLQELPITITSCESFGIPRLDFYIVGQKHPHTPR